MFAPFPHLHLYHHPLFITWGSPLSPFPEAFGAAPWHLLLYFHSSKEREGQGSATHLCFTSPGAPCPASNSNILHSTHETNPVPLPCSRGGTWSPKIQDMPEASQCPNPGENLDALNPDNLYRFPLLPETLSSESPSWTRSRGAQGHPRNISGR